MMINHPNIKDDVDEPMQDVTDKYIKSQSTFDQSNQSIQTDHNDINQHHNY